jgi:hypothetical protein
VRYFEGLPELMSVHGAPLFCVGHEDGVVGDGTSHGDGGNPRVLFCRYSNEEGFQCAEESGVIVDVQFVVFDGLGFIGVDIDFDELKPYVGSPDVPDEGDISTLFFQHLYLWLC